MIVVPMVFSEELIVVEILKFTMEFLLFIAYYIIYFTFNWLFIVIIKILKISEMIIYPERVRCFIKLINLLWFYWLI